MISEPCSFAPVRFRAASAFSERGGGTGHRDSTLPGNGVLARVGGKGWLRKHVVAGA